MLLHPRQGHGLSERGIPNRPQPLVLVEWENYESPFRVFGATGVFGAVWRRLLAQETQSRKVTRDDER